MIAETQSVVDDLEINVKQDEPLREGVLKVDLNSLFAPDKVTEHAKPVSSPEPSTVLQSNSNQSASAVEPEPEKSQKEIFAEVNAAVYGFNFFMVTGSAYIAKMMGKDIDSKNISASDTELKRLAKVAQPVYEKYMTGTSPETLLLITVLGMYGFKIAGEFMGAQDLAKKTTKEVGKATLNHSRNVSDDDQPSWVGDTRYFQTGQKAGTLKPSSK